MHRRVCSICFFSQHLKLLLCTVPLVCSRHTCSLQQENYLLLVLWSVESHDRWLVFAVWAPNGANVTAVLPLQWVKGFNFKVRDEFVISEGALSNTTAICYLRGQPLSFFSFARISNSMYQFNCRDVTKKTAKILDCHHKSMSVSQIVPGITAAFLTCH